MPPLPPSRSHKSDSSSAPDHQSTWQYRKGGKTSKPLSFRELREAAQRGDFSPKDQISRKGKGEWQPASNILGLFPSRGKAPSSKPSPQSNKPLRFSQQTQSPSILDGPPGGLYLPHLHRASFPLLLALFLGGLAFFYLSSIPRLKSQNIILLTSGSIFCVFTLIYASVFLYRAWEMMRMLGAKIRGTRAVGRMLIPLYSAGWVFPAIVGWARLWNRNVRQHPGLSKAKLVLTPLFFLFSCFFALSQVCLLFLWVRKPGSLNFNDPVWIGTSVIACGVTFFGMLSWFQICRSINFLAQKKS